MVEKTVFTLHEVAELLHCNKETVRREIADGQLRAAKIGREYRVSKSDLEEYWASKGGGALFEDSPRPAPGTLGQSRKRAKQTPGPEQLKLPT